MASKVNAVQFVLNLQVSINDRNYEDAGESIAVDASDMESIIGGLYRLGNAALALKFVAFDLSMIRWRSKGKRRTAAK